MSFNSKKEASSEGESSLNKVHDDCKPQTIIVFLAFKLVPIVLYLLLKLLTSQVLLTFILIILLVCADFWMTKNIAGRQLAALRWYSQLSEDNLEKWCFQSSQVRVPSAFNVMVFWFGQFIPIVFWLAIFLINLVTLSAFWAFMAVFCEVLLCSNFICYLQCKGEHQKRVNGLTKRLGVQFFELNEQKS